MKKLKVYLAGPDVFRSNAIEHGKLLKDKLKGYGLKGLYPFDNEVGECDSPEEMARLIYKANIKMIKKCDYVLANLDPFRGPSCDVGTAFEIGYAKALKKPIVGYYCELPREEYCHKVDLFQQMTKGVDKFYSQIERFGLSDNLMVHFGCKEICTGIDDAIQAIIHMRDDHESN